MKVLLTLQDVEPAVRLNALLEGDGIQTAVVSPLDDMRAAIRRERPDIIVFSGDLADPASVALVKEQLWDGAASVGLSDVADDEHLERLRAAGYVELYPKPVSYPEVLAGLAGVDRVFAKTQYRYTHDRASFLSGESPAVPKYRSLSAWKSAHPFG